MELGSNPDVYTTPREAFNELDLDHSGYLSVDELTEGLRRAGLPTNKSSSTALMSAMDTDNDGEVSYPEFLAYYLERYQLLRCAFLALVDEEGRADGFTGTGLREVSAMAGIQLSNRDVADIMSRLDKNKDGVISFEEFLGALLLVPDVNPYLFFDTWFTHFVAVTDTPSVAGLESPRKTSAEHPLWLTIAKKLVCGGTAGVVSRTLTAPLDRLRVVMMTSSEVLGIRAAIAESVCVSGMRGLWTGNGANCLKIAPEMAVKLAAFDYLLQYVSSDRGNVSPGERVLAGAIAGGVGQTMVYPLEVVRTRLAAAGSQEYSGISDCMRRTIRRGGVRALYAGLAPSVLGIFPFAGIDLALNSMLQDRAATYLRVRKRQEVSVPLLLMCGMVSSTVATTFTFPLYVVRTRLQAQGGSLRAVVDTMVKSPEGALRAFYRGYIPAVTKMVPATAISYTVYACLDSMWGHHH